MVSYQLYELFEKTLNEISEHSEFIEFLSKLSNFSNSTMLKLFGITDKQGSAIVESTQEVQREINKIKNFIKTEYSPDKTFHSSRELVEILRKFFLELDTKEDLSQFNIALFPLLNAFKESYGRFLVSHSSSDALILVSISLYLSDNLATLKSSLIIIKSSLQPAPLEFREDLSSFSIHFESHINALELCKKLSAINSIYTQLQIFLKTDHGIPLEIIKVETGSFFGEFLGAKEAIKACKELIIKGAAYLNYEYSEKGKRKQFEEKIQITEKFVNLKQFLEDQGINTERMDEELRISGERLSQELNTLLGGEPQVKVDNQEFKVTSEVEIKLLENKQKLLLPSLENQGDLPGITNPQLPPKPEDSSQ